MTENVLRVVIEQGVKKSFASAVNWPGWSRSGKTEDAAIEQLLAYRERYEEVLTCGKGLKLPPGDLEISVVDEKPGDGTTEFGVPGIVADVERVPIEDDELEQQVAVLQATWVFFDQVAAKVSPELRKGPRGGGRDRDKIVAHVIECEPGYARYLTLKLPLAAIDGVKAIRAQRAAIVDASREHGPAGKIPGKKWPVRYTIRRMAWHVLDHAWEMEDKDLTGESDA